MIPGTGDLRKMRWGLPAQGRGKRGGIRVIYYWYMSKALIYLLMVYPKSKREDLSDRQKQMLRKIAEGLR
ncbi:MAG: type II toxin-antitoxin system RelE/ParE family toxin [Thermoanaerobaculia bacterium]